MLIVMPILFYVSLAIVCGSLFDKYQLTCNYDWWDFDSSITLAAVWFGVFWPISITVMLLWTVYATIIDILWNIIVWWVQVGHK